MYDIRFDPDTCILHVKAEGFWTLSQLAMFSTTVVARSTAARLRHGHFAILNDARLFPVQSNDVARAIEVLANKMDRITKGPVATVVPSTLTKLQAERTLRIGNSRVFLDWDAANAWLDMEWIQKRSVA